MLRDMRLARAILRKFARKCGYVVISTCNNAYIKEALAKFDGTSNLMLTSAGVPLEAFHTQLKQNIAALACNGFKRDDYFVNIGAAEPTNSSNTVMMERDFGWNRIC